METLEFIDKFLKFEYENNLFEKEIRGIKFWQYIRFHIYIEILIQKKVINRESDWKGFPLKEKSKIPFNLIKNSITKNPSYGLKEKEILVLNHERRVKENDYYVEIYVDELLKNMDKTYYVFEKAYMGKHFKPVKTKNLRYMDYIYIEKILRNIFFHFSIDSKTKEEIVTLIKKIKTNFQVILDYDLIKSKLKNLVIEYEFLSKKYKFILKKVKPKVLLEVVYYSSSNMIFNKLAKEMGIKVVELQHGTMGKYHIAYNFYKKYDLEGFPDYIFLFGEFWKENTRFPINDNNLIVTGFPFFEKRIQNCRNNKNKNIKTKKTILFISQGTIGTELSKLADQLNKIIDNTVFDIIYKLHPGEYSRWKQDYPWLINPRIRVIDNNEKHIYYYFNLVDYQVGVYSTALIEGFGFGLKTFIVSLYGHEYMEELYNNGYAKLVHSAEDLKEGICNEVHLDMIKIKDEFWEKNSMENMINALDLVINTK